MLTDSLLLLASLLVFAAVLITKIGSRLGAPALLLFLLMGMLVGEDVIGIPFNNYEAAESIGHFAMTVILFAGGLETSWKETKPVLKQGLLLSTAGLLLTVIMTGLFTFYTVGNLVGGIALSLTGCFLIAAIMSSTDSASVFYILREKKLLLRERLGPMLEFESGSNDPIAYVLTIILVDVLSSGMAQGPWYNIGHSALILMIQMAVGFAIGVAVGQLGKIILEKINLDNSSLTAILILSTGFLANSLASFLHGNGLLALYVTSLIIGNRVKYQNKRDVLKFFDGMRWLMQMVMFLMLGLLARPSQMPQVAVPALLIGLFMLLVARPASTFITLLPFRGMSFKAKLFTSFVGLKGAGPILFALCPVVAGLDGSSEIFNIVFLITLLSLILQGFSLPLIAHKLNLVYDADPEVESFGMVLPEEMGMLRDHLISEDELSAGKTLRDLKLPHGIRVFMVKRDGSFLVPHGSMELKAGDHLITIIGDTDD